jgi:ribosomal protein S11
MIKKRKFYFYFNQGEGNILFFKRHSNLFIVLTDSRRNHVITLTSGVCKLGKTKKQKVAPLNMLIMIQKLKIYLNKYRIRFVNFFIKQNISFYFFNLKKLFKMYNILINEYIYILCIPHRTRRGRKLRRI